MNRRRTAALALSAAALAAALSLPPAAGAASKVIWSAYGGGLGTASASGGSASTLFAGVNGTTYAYGTTADPAAGKLFWIDYGSAIYSANLNGTGTPTKLTDQNIGDNIGLAFDPVGKKLYWANNADGTIRFIKSDGTGAGILLNNSNTAVKNPIAPAVDSRNGKIYWANYGDGTLGVAKLDGTGAQKFSISGTCKKPLYPFSLAVDADGGKLYASGWDGDFATTTAAKLDGTACESIDSGSTETHQIWGLAGDMDAGRLFGGFYMVGAIKSYSLKSLATAAVALNTGTAPTVGASYPVVLAAPKGAVAVTPSTARVRTRLSCSTAWSLGNSGMNFFRAPASVAYRWSLNSRGIAGQTGATIVASRSGKYTCAAVGTNAAGSGSLVSSAATVR